MRRTRSPLRRKAISDNQNDDWINLKQTIAYNISSYSKDYDQNLEIYCDVINYNELSWIIENQLLPVDTEVSDIKGIPSLLEALKESKNFRDTFVIYNELRDFIRRNDDQFKWMITKELKKILKQKQKGDFPIIQIISDLGRKYNLLDEELRIISVLYLWEQWNILEQTLRGNSSSDYVKTISGLCGLSITHFAQLIRNESDLQKKGLIRSQSRHRPNTEVELSPSLLFALSSRDLSLISSGLFRENRDSKYETDQFAIPPLEIDFIISALRSNKSVLIAGEPGIGKTEFAYSIAEFMERSLLNLRIDSSLYSNNLSKSTPQDRILMIKVAANLLQNKNELLLIDEADSILQSAGGFFSFFGNDGSYDKGELNTLLEEIDVPAIWITNSIEKIPDSALRRFAYVYKFPHPDMKVRNRMLKEKLAIVKNDDITYLTDSISRRYDLTPSAMERMVNVVSSAVESNIESGSSSFSDTVEKYLETASKGPLRHDFRKLPAFTESFNPKLSSASTPLDEIINRIQKRTKLGKATRMLFEGPPGGGKTQFSLYLAASIGKEAIIKKPSDLSSKWIGETEKNINAMFRDAELSDAVLILDEADALLSDRSMAQRSWELSQASEFLQGIQNYKGILIACTNRVEGLDPAIRRRFHQKVTFGALRINMINTALKHMFPDIIFTNRHTLLLENGPSLMMSDIANAADMLDTEESLETDMVVNEIIENAKNRDMSKAIGF